MAWGRRRRFYCTNLPSCPHARADLIYSAAAYRNNPHCHGTNNDGCGAQLVEGHAVDARGVWAASLLGLVLVAYASVRWLVPTLFPPPLQGIAFASPVTNVTEGAHAVDLIVQRTGPVQMPTAVTFRTEDGNAKAGQDYVAAEGKLQFAAGERRKTLVVNLLPGAGEGARSFSLLLANVEGAPRHIVSVAPKLPSVQVLGQAETLIRALSALSADIAGMYVKRKHLNRVRDAAAMDDSMRGSYDAADLALQNNMASALERYAELQKDLSALDRRAVGQSFEDWMARLDQKDLQQQLDATRIARRHQETFRKNPVARPDVWASELAQAIPAPAPAQPRAAGPESV